MSKENPYAAHRPQSAYCKTENRKLVHALTGAMPGPRALHLHHQMRATIESPAFPCFGAKTALQQNTYRFAFYADMGDMGPLAHDLYLFAQEQRKMSGNFTTFIACFDGAPLTSADNFENVVWRSLGGLAALDAPHHAWDETASSDPESSDFAFSFAGTSYFVAALSPVSPRLSRRFIAPTLVFNAHYQFQHLRQKGLFEKLRDTIRKKDTALENGIPNDLADDFGGTSEAIQYCGIKPKAGEKWQCPFRRYFISSE